MNEHLEELVDVIKGISQYTPIWRGKAVHLMKMIPEIATSPLLPGTWMTDEQAFVNSLRIPEVVGALSVQNIHIWKGSDGLIRLVVTNPNRFMTPTQIQTLVAPPLPGGVRCKYCGMNEDRTPEELQPYCGIGQSTGEGLVHPQCTYGWRNALILAKRQAKAA